MIRRSSLTYLLAALLLLAVLPGSGARAAPSRPPEGPLTRAQTDQMQVALTFDVTWQQSELIKILAELDAAGVKATFFVGGTFLTLYGDTVRTLSARGHEVGTLGQRMVDLSLQPEPEITSNLLASQSALAKILGGQVRYFRPPLGEATPEVIRGALAANLVTVTHSLDSEDYAGIPADQIVKNVVRRARKGDIIRLTASDWCKETAPALPRIIRGLQAKGFRLVRVSELGAP